MLNQSFNITKSNFFPLHNFYFILYKIYSLKRAKKKMYATSQSWMRIKMDLQPNDKKCTQSVKLRTNFCVSPAKPERAKQTLKNRKRWKKQKTTMQGLKAAAALLIRRSRAESWRALPNYHYRNLSSLPSNSSIDDDIQNQVVIFLLI